VAPHPDGPSLSNPFLLASGNLLGRETSVSCVPWKLQWLEAMQIIVDEAFKFLELVS
jgi:hypothetical protein